MTRGSKQPKVALHVDDDPESLRLISDILERHGFNVVQASNLQDAEILLKKQKVYLCIADGTFPLTPHGHEVSSAGLQLYEIYERIRQKGGNYVILSGYPSLEVECERRGITYIPKGDIGRFMTYLERMR